jgi:type VI secretion system secreted protein VgrG
VFELESQVVGPSQLLRARGAEAMNALPRWEIEILCEAALGDLDGVVGTRAILRWWDELEGTARDADLTIIEIASEGEERRGHRYSLSLAPFEHRLALRSGYRIFLDQTVPAIAAQVLRDAGVPVDRLVLRLAGAYLPRKQCTQYGEREWSFVERLLADEGISYWFDTLDGRQVLVLGDSQSSHDGIVAPVTVPYDDASGLVRLRSLSALELTEEVCTTAVTLRDFDVRNPDVYVDASVGAGPLSHFEYPSFVPSPAAAKTRAQARLEQLQRFKVHARAASDCIRMQPGRLLRLQGCADERMNREYLVVEVEHAYDRPSPDDTHGRPYTNQLLLVPGGEAAFRPAIPTGAPRIEGIESAITTGAPGEEIHVDDLGRVKLRFLWDPSGITDDGSSAWARCLQWGLGGSMLLPRVGWEVPVAYLDGNPDQPFVLGRLYNATAVVPYPLPGAAATTSLKSATSPGGGSTNELRMSDDAGRQEMAIHASKDQSVSVGGSSTTQVSADQTHDVGLMLANVVLGSQSHSVAAVQAIDVGTSFSTAVKGSATMAVGGAELLNATANRTVATGGAYVEVVGSSYALQCNQSNYQVSGRLIQVNGAASLLTAGLGVSESVAGARAEVVGGSYSVVSGGGFSDTVYGAKRIQAGGAAAESAGAAVATSARLGKVKAATATLNAGGEFAISGVDITIEAASLSAGALEISGGALRGTSGTTKVDASVVKHLGGGKVG